MRFQVDERVGCVAVIDANIEFDSNGLHEDSKNVVLYFAGYSSNGGMFSVNNKDIETCEKVAVLLNLQTSSSYNKGYENCKNNVIGFLRASSDA